MSKHEHDLLKTNMMNSTLFTKVFLICPLTCCGSNLPGVHAVCLFSLQTGGQIFEE